MRQINWNTMKMVIPVVGMAICLLSGCLQGKNDTNQNRQETAAIQDAAGKDAGLEELEDWRTEAQRSGRPEQEEASDKEASGENESSELTDREEELSDYRTCMSGTIVEQELTQEELSALFYAQEIPEEVFARMNGVSYVENEDIALKDLR